MYVFQDLKNGAVGTWPPGRGLCEAKMASAKGSVIIERDENAACRRNFVVIDCIDSTFNFCARLTGKGYERAVSSFDLVWKLEA